jgi:hypothetical protein
VSTVHPFFSVEMMKEGEARESLNEPFVDELDPAYDNPVLVISYDDVVVIEGNLHEFAQRVVRAVYGGTARIAFDLHTNSSGPAR